MIDKIDILITTKNRLNELENTITKMCLLGFTQDQFYIIDDASTDNTYNTIQKEYPDVHLFRNEESKGLIFNRSKMMTISERDFVLSLDDDSHIRSKEDIEEAISILLSEKTYGIFHFHVYNQIEEPIEKKMLDDRVYKVKSYIGCGHIIKREVIEKVGVYLNELEFYEEEMDFSLRAFKLGYSVVTNKNLVVHHRIDQKVRNLQKVNINDKGIYGYFWRIKMHNSNRLIIPLIHYPWVIGLFYFSRILIGVFYRTVFVEKKINLFFSIITRVFNLRKVIVKRISKLSYTQFNHWLKLPNYPSGGN